MSGIDWPGLMRLGLGQMRLTPATFWALTPAEFLLLTGREGAAALGRSHLERLMARFPDTSTKGETQDGRV